MPDPFDSFQLPSELRELLPNSEQHPLREEILGIHVRLLKRDPELEDNRSRGLHLQLLFDAIASRLQSQPEFREHIVPALIPKFVQRIKSDLSWYPNSDENLGSFLNPVIVQWQNSNSKNVEAGRSSPLLNNPPEGEREAEPFHPTAPNFRYQYPAELPDTEQLVIENARLEANECHKKKEITSFDDYRRAYVAWFWRLIFAAANAIGRAGERLHWGANRRRELLTDYALKAAQAADIAGRYGYSFKELCESPEWRAADDCLLRPEPCETGRESNISSVEPTGVGAPQPPNPVPQSPTTEISQTSKRRGRRPNPGRREAIREALSKHGDQWRDHLHEIFPVLDGAAVSLGDFQGVKISLGDGESQTANKWEDLDLAEGEERARIIDALRKYLD
jgi:hypothetical protein